MKVYSLTYTGVIVSVLGFLLDKFKIEYATGEIEAVVASVIMIIGWIIALYGKYRQGDVKVWGGKI